MQNNQRTSVEVTSFRIIIGLVTGFLMGALCQQTMPYFPLLTDWVITCADIIGTWFLSSIKLFVVPIVFVSISLAMVKIDLGRSKRLFATTIAVYVLTTMIAVTLSLTIAHISGVGAAMTPLHPYDLSTDMAYIPSFSEQLKAIVPTNFIQAFLSNNMLSLIFMAIFLGVAMRNSARIKNIIRGLSTVDGCLTRGILMIMTLAPYGVFFLTTHIAFEMGWSTVTTLCYYFAIGILILTLHWVCVYGGVIRLLLKRSPIAVFRAAKDALIFGFCVSSSSATIPLTMSVLEQKLKARSQTTAFVVPLGATINMDGTAMIQALAVVFIANLYGVSLHFSDYVMVVLMSLLASIGTAGIPSAGLFVLAMVLNQLGLPLDGISLILGVDRLLDMLRTSVNISGDITTTLLVDRLAGDC